MATDLTALSIREGDQLDELPSSRLACEIESRFGERLRRLAQRKLDRRLASRVDEYDVLQSTLRSFFVRHGRGQLVLESWNDLWRLLAVMTHRKCLKQAQVHFADRRDARRDVGLDASQPAADGCLTSAVTTTVDDSVLLTEATNRLLQRLDRRESEVVALVLAGRTVEQVSRELRRTQRTVRRLLGRVRQQLERLAGEMD